jgi:hypothetical protein
VRQERLAALARARQKPKCDGRFELARALHRVGPGEVAMIGAIGLAMGALSTVSSMVDQAAANVSKAVNTTPQAPDFPSPAAAPAAAKKAMVPSTAINHGVPIPKFDRHAHAHLLSLQAQR